MPWENDKSRHYCMRRNMRGRRRHPRCAPSDDARRPLGDKLGRILVTVLGMVAEAATEIAKALKIGRASVYRALQ